MSSYLRFSIFSGLTFAFFLTLSLFFTNTAHAATTLYARVLQDATIDLKFSDGTKVTTLPAGAYTVQVTDTTVDHNFHLTGPGVDQTTSVSGLASPTWQVNLTPGTYTFICDPHPSWMRGTFTVTAAPVAAPVAVPTPVAVPIAVPTPVVNPPATITPTPVSTSAHLHPMFSVGDSAVTLTNLNVRSTPSVSGPLVAIAIQGTAGVVQEISSAVDGYIWIKMRYSTGLTGWSVQNWLSKGSGATAPSSTSSFGNGDAVETSDKLRVRLSPSLLGTPVGIVAKGERGTVAGQSVTADNYTWWKIQFTNGLSGWSVGNWLQKRNASVGSTPTTPTAIPISSAASPLTTGSAVVTLENLRVRTTPSTSGGLIGVVTGNSVGTIVDPSTTIADGYLWRKVQFSNGVTGWAADTFLGVPSPASVIPISTITPATPTPTQTILPAPPTLTSTFPPPATIGQYYSYQIAATNNPTSFVAQALPPGLTINPVTGLISGAPNAAGDYLMSFSVINAGGMVTARFTFTVIDPATNVVTIPTTTTNTGSTGGTTSGSGTVLIARVLTDATIDLKYPNGTPVTSIPAGVYSIQVTDTTADHNFHLTGTGVDQTTSVPGIANTTWQVTFSPGTYTFLCDPHPSWMRGTFTVTAANNSQQQTTTNNPPGITSSSPLTATVGTAYSYQLTATNNPTSFAASSLPPGLTINQTTGLVSGTPTTEGSYLVTLSATNAYGSSAATMSIPVVAVASNNPGSGQTPPAITSSLASSGTVGISYSYQITASNNPTTYAASSLPAGLSINTNTGVISGVPTVAGGSSTLITATNATGSGNAIMIITIVAQQGQGPGVTPAITSPLSFSGLAGSPFAYQITASNGPTNYAASGLPSGLTINGTTGLISGTIAVGGNYTITLSASNTGGTGTATLSLAVAVPGTPASTPPSITSSLTSSGTVGSAFSYQISASNSPTSRSASSLPPGLSVNSSTGVISGTPAAAGTYFVAISATNAGGTGSAMLTLTINSAQPAGQAPTVTNSVSVNGTVGSSYALQIVATNNPTSYSASGLPSGVFVNTASGMISGTPTVAGNYTMTLQASNAYGTGSKTLSIGIASAPSPQPISPPAITSSLSSSGTVGTAFSYQISASNNPTTRSASGLPLGLSVNTSTGVISGTPAASGTYFITISATNAGGTGSATLTITIASAPSSGTTLIGRVLNDATIDIRTTGGVMVTSLPAGAYTIQITDSTADHNIHLTGPGVDIKTSVSAQVTTTWQVTFTPGTYTYICDPHASWMRGSFTVQ